MFEAKRHESQAALKIVGTFREFDLIVTPTMPTVAYDAEALFPEGAEMNELGYYFDHNPFTWPFNVTLQPAASVPCGLTAAGLPVGLQIAGQHHDDFGVLQAARAYEANFPAIEEWPAL
jgi:Asp-tRNA(Asn)/Glu-tRNA(Gln) amidotransferase A subunit family amidase